MKKLVKKIIGCFFMSVFLLFIIIAAVGLSQQEHNMAAASYSFTNEASRNKDIISDYTSPCENVKKLKNIIMDEATIYGKEEYINLFLAIAQFETEGIDDDVFNCYENIGIECMTQEESVKTAVKYISELIDIANVADCKDYDRIRLALQAYNFGKEFVDFALGYNKGTMYEGGWSQAATNIYAKEKSGYEKRSGEAATAFGIWNYKNQYYSDYILNYYNADDILSLNVVDIALSKLGCPYAWGACGPIEFDCSGFIYYVFKEAGIYTGERTTAKGYAEAATLIPVDEAREGDLIFFSNKGIVHHVGIYLGSGMMIHAPEEGDVIKISSIRLPGEMMFFGRLQDK